MKNKKLLYLLLLSAILVWGIIIYKVFLSNDNNADANTFKEQIQINKADGVESDTHLLLLNYTDPFLKTSVVIKDNSKPKTDKKLPVLSQINWPKINYTGMIKNKVTNEIRANITINNKNYIMKELDIRNDITLEEIHNEFVILSKNKNLKTINKPK